MDSPRSFLGALYSNAPDGTLALCSMRGTDRSSFRAHRFPRGALDAASAEIEALASTSNVYAPIALYRSDLREGRGTEADTTALVGIGFDADDVDADTVLRTLQRTFGEPSCVIDSGNGAHAWYLFREPWCFVDDTERAKAKQLLTGVHETLRKSANADGWTYDPLADLTRVLRVPGTWNRKDENAPKPVTLLYESDARYSPEDFERFAPATPRAPEDGPQRRGGGGGTADACGVRRLFPVSSSLLQRMASDPPEGEQKKVLMGYAISLWNSDPKWTVEDVVEACWPLVRKWTNHRPEEPWTEQIVERVVAEAIVRRREPEALREPRLRLVQTTREELEAEIATRNAAGSKERRHEALFDPQFMGRVANFCREDKAKIGAFVQIIVAKNKSGNSVDSRAWGTQVRALWRTEIQGEDALPEQATIEEIETTYWLKKATGSGPVLKKLSNFTMRVLQRLDFGDEGEGVSVEITNDRGAVLRRDFLATSLNSVTRFREALRSTEAIWIENDDSALQLLRIHLMASSAPRRYATTKLGTFKPAQTEYFVLPGVTLDPSSWERWAPCSDDVEVQFVDPYANPIVEQLLSGGREAFRWPTREEHQEAARALFSHGPVINDVRVTMPLWGWFFISPRASEIREHRRADGFPLLNLRGSTGAGKTSTAHVALRAFGYQGRIEANQMSPRAFGRDRLYDASRSVVVHFDEYRQSTLGAAQKHVDEEFRLLYNGGKSERGTGGSSARKYTKTAPTLVLGEDRPEDLATRARFILLSPKRSGQRKMDFLQLRSAPLEAFFLPYVAWLLTQEWEAVLFESHQRVLEWWTRQEFSDDVDHRLPWNLAVITAGDVLMRRYAEMLELEVTPYVGGTIEDAWCALIGEGMPDGQAGSNLDQFVLHMHTLTTTDALKSNVHYSVKENLLCIYLPTTYLAMQNAFRGTPYQEQLLTESSYEQQFRDASEDAHSYVVEFKKQVSFYPDGQRRQLRTMVLDLDRLHAALGIDRSAWGIAQGVVCNPIR